MEEEAKSIVRDMPKASDFSQFSRMAQIQEAFKKAVAAIKVAVSDAFKNRTASFMVRQRVDLAPELMVIWMRRRDYITLVLNRTFEPKGYIARIADDGTIVLNMRSTF